MRARACRGAGARRRQSGVALIAAVLVVALAVVLVAALLDTGEATRARTRNALRAEQTWQLMHGIELWAAQALRQHQALQPNLDTRGDPWAQPLPPLDIDGGRVFGRLRERNGCFDVNTLVDDNRLTDEAAVDRFKRVLAALRLDPAIAVQAADWIDGDADPGASGGAEDLHYLQRDPPYRAANRRMAHVSELRLLPAVDAQTYAQLLPHVCALPERAPINLNFASVPIWMSLHPNITESIARAMVQDGQARFGSLDAIRNELGRQLGLGGPLPLDEALYRVESRYFVIDAEIVVDGIPIAYSSLLERRPLTGEVHVLQRVRGRL